MYCEQIAEFASTGLFLGAKVNYSKGRKNPAYCKAASPFVVKTGVLPKNLVMSFDNSK